MITDEMVGIAENAYDFAIDATEEACSPSAMRAALEAVAPMLQKALTDADICRAKAQGMREAAKIAVGAHDPRQMTLAERLLAIEARAQELDPQ